MDAPCKDCEFRKPLCHAECEIYKAWKAEFNAAVKNTDKENAALSEMWNYGHTKKRRK